MPFSPRYWPDYRRPGLAVKLLVAAVFLALSAIPALSLPPDALPSQGETLLINSDATLLIPVGMVASLNGTILVEGNTTSSPSLDITCLGGLRLSGNSSIVCRNGGATLTNLGAITGRSLFLHSLQGGNLTLLQRGLIDMDHLSISSWPRGLAAFNASRESILRLGGLEVTSLNSTVRLLMRGEVEGDAISIRSQGSPSVEALFDASVEADKVRLQAERGRPVFLVNGRWEAKNLTMNVTGAGSMSLQINGEISAENVVFLSQGPGYANTNLVLNGNLSAIHLALRSNDGGMLTVQTTGQIRSDELSCLCRSGRLDIFNWGSILLGASLLRSEGANGSISLWQAGNLRADETYLDAVGGGKISLLQAQGSRFELGALLMNAAGWSNGSDGCQSSISVRSEEGKTAWQLGTFYSNVTDGFVEFVNGGLAEVENIYWSCSGSTGKAVLENLGNLSVGNLNMKAAGGTLEFLNHAECSVHNSNVRLAGGGMFLNRGSLSVVNIFATDLTNVTNAGSMVVRNMRIFAGDSDVVNISNYGVLSVTGSDIDVFSYNGTARIWICNAGRAQFGVIDLFSNVPVPSTGSRRARARQIRLVCSPGGNLSIKSLRSNTAGEGGVYLTLGCETRILRLSVSGNSDVHSEGSVQIESFTGPDGRPYALNISNGQSFSISEVEISTGASGSVATVEASLLAPALSILAAALAWRMRDDSGQRE